MFVKLFSRWLFLNTPDNVFWEVLNARTVKRRHFASRRLAHP